MNSAKKFIRLKNIPSHKNLILAICFLLLASLIFIGFRKQQRDGEKYTQLSSFSCSNIQSASLPPVDNTYTLDTQSTSPDGTKQITVKTYKKKEAIDVDPREGKYQQYYTWQKAILTGTAVSHPIELVNEEGNFSDEFIITWSPDSRYFYTIKHGIHGDNIVVFRTDGAKFSSGKCYLVGTAIASRTNRPDYGINTPYWFDVISDSRWLNNSQIHFLTVPDIVFPPGITSPFTQKRKYRLDVEKETLQSSLSS